MKAIYLVFVLCCCVCSNFGGQRMLQPAKWRPVAVAATTLAPMVAQHSRQARRSEQTNAKLNETNNETSPLLVNGTDVMSELEKEESLASYDHKHRVLLAVQSDVKVRDTTKQKERLRNLSLKNDASDSRKRFKKPSKSHPKELMSKFHRTNEDMHSSFEETEPVVDVASIPIKSKRPQTNTVKKNQRLASFQIIECGDIPYSEALLNSAFVDDMEGVKSKNQEQKQNKPKLLSAADVEDLLKLQRKLLKSRRNQLKMMPRYHRFPPYIRPANLAAYNRFNFNNPCNHFDYNYYFDPMSEVDVPTVEYIWEENDDAADNIADLINKNLQGGE
ncbi:uncharacterized protein LOC129237590 [Anastrepha obliqua]|uniref:uncharacterized protein LOC129237590 n=1 Tax=Anastrepha obliqua TaxID=95512 RepID=UPI00240A28BB|nr:uncharacterized protein LOC129237590 [Anastrepha obliqua]